MLPRVSLGQVPDRLTHETQDDDGQALCIRSRHRGHGAGNFCLDFDLSDILCVLY